MSAQLPLNHQSPRMAAPMEVLASFVKDKVLIDALGFYLVPLVYVSVFVPILYCLDGCNFVVQSQVRKTDSSSSVCLCQNRFGYLVSFVFPYNL